MIDTFVHYILHFDQALPELIAQYGLWVYAIAFMIIYCETGLVVTPFLPGDSMLFALGAFAARGSLDIWMLAPLLFIAAVAGDNTNYLIGRKLGTALLRNPRQKLFKAKHYERTHAFYEKYGPKAIILARFVPIVRTFSPFVAGVARMSYRSRFLPFDVMGGALWIGIFLGMGYALGNVPWVQTHFEVIVPVIIVVSVLPIVWEFAAHKLRARREGLVVAGDKE